jgi:glutathione S-transferase
MKLYYSPGACSLATHILLEEIGRPYELIKVPVWDKSNRKRSYLAINPRGYIPALAVDDWVMTENTAIMLYLASRFPQARLLPSEPRALAKCLEWAVWQTNTLHIAFSHVWRPERFLDRPKDYRILAASGEKRLRRHFLAIEDWLSHNSYAAGSEYSMADPMFLVFYIWGADADEMINAKAFPHWTAHLQRLTARPAVQRALSQEK